MGFQKPTFPQFVLSLCLCLCFSLPLAPPSFSFCVSLSICLSVFLSLCLETVVVSAYKLPATAPVPACLPTAILLARMIDPFLKFVARTCQVPAYFWFSILVPFNELLLFSLCVSMPVQVPGCS